VAAVKAALDEGVVPGGEVTLVDLSKQIDAKGSGSAVAGAGILKNALVQPFRQLMGNAGLNPDEKLPKVLDSTKSGQGFDVNNPAKLVDMKAQGVVDPTRVVKEAIQNATSIAATAMTMGALVVELPEKKEAPAAPDMGGMGMM
jgi:chaperonin GroEL